MKIWGHFCTITRHKILVMRHCFRVGLYKQGMLHDLSKYSPSEFWIGCKYYQGTRSPNNAEREETGCSTAWLHHKGRNKHHAEYWYDELAPEPTPIIPYQYLAEMVCDKMAAGIIYEGKNWTKEFELLYWTKEKDKIHINEKVSEFITEILQQVAKDGIDKVFTSNNFKQNYEKYCK